VSDDPFGQHGFRCRLEWGLDGMRRLSAVADVVVVVDVLRFTTCVDVVVAGGGSVTPLSWSGVDDGPIPEGDLSPARLAERGAGIAVAIPSPNGATLCLEGTSWGAPVLAGCLRNATAVGLAADRLAGTGVVAVVAAGERWGEPPGRLRVAVEDLVGAGAVLAAVGRAGCSPEALAAVETFESAAGDLAGWLGACGSGRELAAKGFGEDVEVAARLDASDAVPVLRDGAFVLLQ
jgi:2-phosphosulfolactate phosphatase